MTILAVILASAFAWGASLAALILALLFFLETAAFFLPARKRPVAPSPCPRIAVVVPAHNEGPHIAATIGDARAALRESDRLIVVADNCTDDTAAIAERLGAEVIVRHDAERRGKGYALQFAIDHLRASPPDCVAFFDADCRFAPDAVTALAGAACAEGRPAQALYIMQAPENAPPRLSVAAFAWLMINRVRMTGLYNLADVTRFTGSGMAAPWAVISQVDLATGAITEDLLVTFKMAEAGAPPMLLGGVEVTSRFPEAEEASVTQRARWEHGSLALLSQIAGPALWKGLVKADPRRIMLALDLMIPPLMMLALLIAAAVIMTGVLWPLVGAGPLFAALAAAALFAVSITAGWLACGRAVLPVSQLGAIVPFMLEKFRIYGSRGRASSKTWTRTKRQGEDE